MEWAVIYRLSNTGNLYAVAKFMFHAEAKKYVEKLNKSEPGHYFMQLEKITL